MGRDLIGLAAELFVSAAQRLWVEDDTMIQGSWVGELQRHYSAFYSNTAAVDGLLNMTDRGWRVQAYLHLADFRCPPLQGWYARCF